MKLFGLKPSEMQTMKKLFQDYFGDIDDAKIYLFGSRAIGKHKGLGPDLKKNGKKSIDTLNKFLTIFERYK